MQIVRNFILPSINHKDIIAFACNTKSFEIPFVFFSLFFLPSMAFGRAVKSFLFMFYHSLPRNRVTRIGLFSLDTLKMFSLVFSLL